MSQSFRMLATFAVKSLRTLVNFSVTTVPRDIKVRLHRTIGNSAFDLELWQCIEA